MIYSKAEIILLVLLVQVFSIATVVLLIATILWIASLKRFLAHQVNCFFKDIWLILNQKKKHFQPQVFRFSPESSVRKLLPFNQFLDAFWQTQGCFAAKLGSHGTWDDDTMKTLIWKSILSRQKTAASYGFSEKKWLGWADTNMSLLHSVSREPHPKCKTVQFWVSLKRQVVLKVHWASNP